MSGKPYVKQDKHGRVCCRCNVYKTWDCFQKNIAKTYGHTSHCKECDKGVHSAATKRSTLSLKRTTMAAYGGCCACCSEDHLEFLTIDHVNNDGAEHRREIGSRGGHTFYRWLKQNGYPGGFQVLCWNCNCARHYFGVCPHQSQKEAA